MKELPHVPWPEDWSEPRCRAYIRAMREAGYVYDDESTDEVLLMRRPPTTEEEEAIIERANELLGR